MKSDAQLLRDYAERANEAAFREIVTRHTDFVYSAALRQVESSAVASDLAQSVFTDLARKAQPLAEKITGDSSLAGWLHRSTRYAALNHLRDARRRRDNERQAMEQLLTNSDSAADWEQIRPALDEALDSLADDDREALLLRYFKNHDFHAVGHALGVSDDTAQKRVSRAVEKLREFFAERKITVGAGGLVVLISANAVQAAPVGLAVTISAAALAGTAVSISNVIAATKTIAMTTLQKTVITAAFVAAAGAGIFEARQAAQLRVQNQTLQQSQAPLAEQIQQLQRERDDATNRLASMADEIAKIKSNNLELLKLRGMVGMLKTQVASSEKQLAQKAEALSAGLPHSAWQLREHRKIGEFQNVGNETPEATAETILWAAQSQATNLINMIHLPTEVLTKAHDEGMTDVLIMQLATKLMFEVRVVAKDEQQQVWLDGGDVTTFNEQTKDGTNTYTGVIDFHLSGRENTDDPATEHHTDFLFAKIDGVWKLVIPGLSPEIR